jgi:hypothetical protein
MNSAHRDAWDLIPWLVNGRLEAADRQRLEAHCRDCASCREELAAQRELYAQMSRGTVEHVPVVSLKRLQQRLKMTDAIDDEGFVPPSSARSASPVRFAGLAAGLAAVCCALGLWAWTRSQPLTGATYSTVTSAPARTGAVIRAVFEPAMTLAEMKALLDRSHLKIVAGPSEAGVYSLSSTSAQPVPASLQELRDSGRVRFAEATAPSDAAR